MDCYFACICTSPSQTATHSRQMPRTNTTIIVPCRLHEMISFFVVSSILVVPKSMTTKLYSERCAFRLFGHQMKRAVVSYDGWIRIQKYIKIVGISQ